MEYCVQYRETDFNFISRLMEQNGIFYFFEHEEGKHTMVIADSSSAHEECPKQTKAGYNLVSGRPRRGRRCQFLEPRPGIAERQIHADRLQL